MNIENLPIGTKLMWDADPIGDWYNNGQRITYPALIIDRNKNNGAKVLTGHKANWMGKENENLRIPTNEELNTLNWPTAQIIN